VKLVSWNVNGLRSVHRNGYWDAFLHLNPDIFCLQETKVEPNQLPAEVREIAGYSSFFSFSKGRKGYSGTALYTKEAPLRVIEGMGIPEFDDEGRIIGGEFKNFYLLNVYFPNGGKGPERLNYKLRFYDAFLAYILLLEKKKPVIFCGDINTAHEAIDLARPKENEQNTGFLPEERAWIDEVIFAGFVDVFRHMHPNKEGYYTYWDMKTRARDRNVGWRIDYFFVSRALLPRITKADIHSDIFGSDHCPIAIELL
jgi:exodeoxyribonuclease-3